MKPRNNGRRNSDLIAAWIEAHEKSDAVTHAELKATQVATLGELRGLRDDMKPVVKVYQTATQAGGWVIKALLLLLTLLGAWLGWLKYKV